MVPSWAVPGLPGAQWIVAVVSNATRSVTATYSSPDALVENNIVINEIMYNPVVSGAGYVEIYNRSTNYAFDLSGWKLNGSTTPSRPAP